MERQNVPLTIRQAAKEFIVTYSTQFAKFVANFPHIRQN